MSKEKNTKLARKLCDAFNAGDIDALDKWVAPNCIDRTAVPGQAAGLEGLKQAWAQLRFSFPGICLKLNDLAVKEDQIALQATFCGLRPAADADQATLLEAFRISDGKIIEMWNVVRWN